MENKGFGGEATLFSHRDGYELQCGRDFEDFSRYISRLSWRCNGFERVLTGTQARMAGFFLINGVVWVRGISTVSWTWGGDHARHGELSLISWGGKR